MPTTRDQQRAARAYRQVSGLPADTSTRDDYKIAVRSLGANILRGGLSAGIASLLRKGNGTNGASHLLAHIAASQIPDLANVTPATLYPAINGLEVRAYMLATRETLQVVSWLKRASDALIQEAQETRRQEPFGGDVQERIPQ
jgi:CRISPR-associated protein Cmr5